LFEARRELLGAPFFQELFQVNCVVAWCFRSVFLRSEQCDRRLKYFSVLRTKKISRLT